MLRRLSLFPLLATLPLLLLWPLLALSADSAPSFDFDKAQATLKEVSRQIKAKKMSAQHAAEAVRELEQLRGGAQTCIEDTGALITRLEEETASLGSPGPHDSPETVKERRSLEKRKQAQQVALSECRLALTLATRVGNELDEYGRQLQKEGVLSRAGGLDRRFAASLSSAGDVFRQWASYLTERSGLDDLGVARLLPLALLMLGGGVAAARISRPLFAHRAAPASRASFTLAGGFLAGAAFLGYIFQEEAAMPYTPWLLLALATVLLAMATLRLRTLRWSMAPALSSGSLLATATLAIVLLFSSRLQLDAYPAAQESLYLGQSLLLCLLALAICRLFWPLTLQGDLARLEAWRRPTLVAATLALVAAELAGFRNLTVFVLLGLLGTALVASMLRFGLLFIERAIGGLLPGRYHWQRRLRDRLGLVADDSLPSITWLLVLGRILAWALALRLFLDFWGVPDATLKKVHLVLLDGFTLGDLRVVPARLVLGVLIFAIGWTVFAWLRMRMERQWLDQAGFSQSAQDTLVTMTGYCGFALALLFGLATAGFSFSNLAVIAGALSVGIGFGMQNIVNNFVSGLIILFERPIKRGDWVRIGTTEGHVQKISVRSTLIKTFDRADVIVPNSELISGQVTNMTLNDSLGRLIVPVGVAYGTDIELVRRLLLEIAASMEEVVNDGSAPAPVVFFLTFGPSSLDFELRCHLNHIDNRLAVKSAINFEIDRLFRLHGITIPFPQQEVYIKEFPFPGGASASSPPAAPTPREGGDARD